MIGAIFESSIKYTKLSELIESEITNIKYSNNINFLIDLKSIYRKVFRANDEQLSEHPSILIEDISSYIINIIGHYRNFVSKYGKYATFYVFYSTQKCKNLIDQYPSYKKYYYDKYFDSDNQKLITVLKSVTNQIKIIMKYIPHVYFVDTSEFDEFVFVNYTIRELLNKSDLNFILSSDPILYQALSSNTFALDLKGDSTSLISEKNVIDYLTKSENNFSGNLLTLVLAIVGNQEYSIDKIETFGYKKACKIINSLILSTQLIDKTYMQFPDNLCRYNKVLGDYSDLLKTNFNILFPINLQFQNSIKLKSAFIVNKPKATIAQFMELNNKFFLYFPLNITTILRGESL